MLSIPWIPFCYITPHDAHLKTSFPLLDQVPTTKHLQTQGGFDSGAELCSSGQYFLLSPVSESLLTISQCSSVIPAWEITLCHTHPWVSSDAVCRNDETIHCRYTSTGDQHAPLPHQVVLRFFYLIVAWK